jgi:hypothetical protein
MSRYGLIPMDDAAIDRALDRMEDALGIVRPDKVVNLTPTDQPDVYAPDRSGTFTHATLEVDGEKVMVELAPPEDRRDAPLDPVMGRANSDRRNRSRRTADKLEQRLTGKGSTTARGRSIDLDIALREIERALEEFAVQCSALGMGPRERGLFDSMLAHLELAKRSVASGRRK